MVASMNEADTSVEPLDVAFQRRFHIYRLTPEPKIAATFLGISEDPLLPETATAPEHIYGALWRAWKAVNARIALGRSQAFQIGHGILMWAKPPDTLAEAYKFASECWSRIEAHVDEVFFGNDQARAVVFNANERTSYRLNEAYFGDQPVAQLVKDSAVDLYKLLQEIGTDQKGA